MSFLGFANYYRGFIKGYADKVYPKQKPMRNKEKSSNGAMKLKRPLRT